ncbi:MAG: exodeoxyribonuclease VII large subunit [Bacteroidota bacterium]|nr:exodeoxyribonuclease VII large subunit [Bacteroidota bacterium]
MSSEKLFLSELQSQIQEVLEQGLDYRYHIIAEISSISESHTGHAYLDLVEKEEGSEQLKAKARATVWAYTYRMLKPYFNSVTGEDMQEGMKVSLTVSVTHHPVYGMSLNVTDIDPEYTLGDIEKQRLEVIRRLEEEGVFDMNKDLALPLVPQHIALISSETAAGYEDFMNQIHTNEFGYVPEIEFFPALVQGNKAPESIVEALDKIFARESEFDLVILVRGGGSKSDLACFDDYRTAVNIAQFPIPVVTGIGHERDTSVTDMVANRQLKTPTAAAEFIIDRFYDFETQLDRLYDSFAQKINQKLQHEQLKISSLSEKLSGYAGAYLKSQTVNLEHLKVRLVSESKYFINKEISNVSDWGSGLQKSAMHFIDKHENEYSMSAFRLKVASEKFLSKKQSELSEAEQKISSNDPQKILKQGYSYTKQAGKVITESSELQPGDVIVTQFYKGEKESTVN